ncbi:GNAT family N-acetyltransferase [Longimicrobium sp.]|uniref:GNAT family N-acetyltransferase n=1 Tax=Longimicrobium sp. TaxID=2029185 RepID=UPI002E2F2976|nr:GNAT family N-acetyltransferase [Longimicrobium sp.]HEX6040585.1 GNAT family N-acetyltransferase [Longimicrobium sp.]
MSHLDHTDPLAGLTARPVAELTAAECAAAMERCFEGYIVPVRVTAESWERRFRGEHLDGYASRVYYAGDRPAAVLFITRRGWTSRVGGMAVARELRGAGVGRRVMQSAIDDARARGDHALLLEVIEQNTPAVKLYDALGFQVVRRLVGWRWTPPADAAPSADALREVDPAEVARIAVIEGEAELPWMLAPETLFAATPPARAFALEDHAYAVLSNPDAETVSVPALVVPRAHRRQGWGTRMLRALAAAFPGRAFQVVAIVPEELAPEFFVHAGCERASITQFDMRLELISRT